MSAIGHDGPKIKGRADQGPTCAKDFVAVSAGEGGQYYLIFRTEAEELDMESTGQNVFFSDIPQEGEVVEGSRTPVGGFAPYELYT